MDAYRKPIKMKRTGVVSYPDIDTYEVEVVSINVSGELAPPIDGVYYASTGSSLDFELNIINENGDVQSQIDDLGLSYPPLKIPLLKVAEGGKGNVVGEAYINAQLRDGVLTGSFSAFPSSGNWQIDINRVNDALQSIRAKWRVKADKFIFLV